MASVGIIADRNVDSSRQFVARTGDNLAVGETAGQALDALNAVLITKPMTNSATVVVIQQSFQPDVYFSAQQKERLDELMTVWRRARDTEQPFSPELQKELDTLISIEWEGAIRRSQAMCEQLGK